MSDPKGTMKRVIESKLQRAMQEERVAEGRGRYLAQVAASQQAALVALTNTPQDAMDVMLGNMVSLARVEGMTLEQVQALVAKEFEIHNEAHSGLGPQRPAILVTQ